MTKLTYVFNTNLISLPLLCRIQATFLHERKGCFRLDDVGPLHNESYDSLLYRVPFRKLRVHPTRYRFNDIIPAVWIFQQVHTTRKGDPPVVIYTYTLSYPYCIIKTSGYV